MEPSSPSTVPQENSFMFLFYLFGLHFFRFLGILVLSRSQDQCMRYSAAGGVTPTTTYVYVRAFVESAQGKRRREEKRKRMRWVSASLKYATPPSPSFCVFRVAGFVFLGDIYPPISFIHFFSFRVRRQRKAIFFASILLRRLSSLSLCCRCHHRQIGLGVSAARNCKTSCLQWSSMPLLMVY